MISLRVIYSVMNSAEYDWMGVCAEVIGPRLFQAHIPNSASRSMESLEGSTRQDEDLTKNTWGRCSMMQKERNSILTIASTRSNSEQEGLVVTKASCTSMSVTESQDEHHCLRSSHLKDALGNFLGYP